MADPQVDIKENEIFELSPELLNTLLKDHSLSTETEQVNIFRATDNYADRGEGYQYCDRSESVEEIDRQLYDKYSIYDEEIAFIESMIKPM